MAGDLTTVFEGLLTAVHATRAMPDPSRIGEALDRAFDSGVPYLVNVLTDPEAAYPRSATGV
ncbi:MAG: hypothetical protein M3O94_03970 [Actinomycetota bacterium]|nr:hypothetical protein [Actinomycetota bacterium]